jgi:hypothetical protein
MEGIKADNLTEEQKFDIAAQTNLLGEALAENVALRNRLEAMEQKLQAFMQAQGHKQQVMSPNGVPLGSIPRTTGMNQEQLNVLNAAATHAQPSNVPAPQGYVHVTIPLDIASSIYGQMTHKQWRRNGAKNKPPTAQPMT